MLWNNEILIINPQLVLVHSSMCRHSLFQLLFPLEGIKAQSDFARILPAKFGEMETLLNIVFSSSIASPAGRSRTRHVNLMSDSHNN